MDGGSITASSGQVKCLGAVTLAGCVVAVPEECRESVSPKPWFSSTAQLQLRKHDVAGSMWPTNTSRYGRQFNGELLVASKH